MVISLSEINIINIYSKFFKTTSAANFLINSVHTNTYICSQIMNACNLKIITIPFPGILPNITHNLGHNYINLESFLNQTMLAAG